MDIFSSKIKKLVIYKKMELSSSKKFLIFLIFANIIFSYILRNETF